MSRLAGAPRLLTACLILRNRHARFGWRHFLFALLAMGALALKWRGNEVGEAVDWLQSHELLSAAVAAVAGAVLTARRRVQKRTEFARSWLAAVPASRGEARREALFIEMLPATAAIVALAFICAPRWAVWAWLGGGIALGAIFSYAIPAPKPIDLPPGSRYVPHQSTAGAGRPRPSLNALGSWPLRQMFAWAQPKMVARAILPVLLAMPMGTMADAALLIVVCFAIAGALCLLVSAAISCGVKVRRWTAPLPMRTSLMWRHFLAPTLCTMAVAAAVFFLLCSMLGK